MTAEATILEVIRTLTRITDSLTERVAIQNGHITTLQTQLLRTVEAVNVLSARVKELERKVK